VGGSAVAVTGGSLDAIFVAQAMLDALNRMRQIGSRQIRSSCCNTRFTGSVG
jgi:hypothetical protein